METAVYLFTGFLEAGKTKFISETMTDPNFNDGKRKYLIISCEEGEEELDPESLPKNISFASFDDVQKITPDRLSAMQKRAGADIVVVEYNGMWTLDSFYNALPENWMVYQEIFIADSTTILSYNANMRQLVVDKLTSCEMVVFNRVAENADKMALHKLVRGVSRKANICYEDNAGEIEFDQIEDPLPYDVNASVIDIKDEDFAEFYRDLNEDTKKYDGKTIMFKGIVARNETLPADLCLVGRHIMTCCEDDIAYGGMLCVIPKNTMVNNRDWLMVTAKIKYQHHELYEGKGPVLYAEQLVHSPAPIEPLATFY